MAKSLAIAPAVGSDWLRLFDSPDQWKNCRSQLSMLQVSYQSLWNEASVPWFNDNIWPNVQAAGVVDKCQKWSIDFGFYMGVWKPQYLTSAQLAVVHARQCCDNLFNAGAFSTIIDLDEPFYDAKFLGVTDLATAAGRVADFYGDLKTIYGDRVGVALTEPYPPPALTCDEIIDSMAHLMGLGVTLEWFDIDVNHVWVNQNPVRLAQMEVDLPRLADWLKAADIPFGIIFWPGLEKRTTNQMYCEGVLPWVDQVAAMTGLETPGRLVSESWIFTDENRTQKALPTNLPESERYTHTWLIREIAERFGWGQSTLRGA
jgi:hypothetical protein